MRRVVRVEVSLVVVDAGVLGWLEALTSLHLNFTVTL